MARSLTTSLRALGEKAERLAAQRDRLAKENQDLRDQLEELRQELDDTRQQRHKAELEVEFLTVSYKLAGTPAKLADARRHVARLIRILDRCIALLRDDPAL